MKPDVVTVVKIPGTEFSLHVYAFRKINQAEANFAAALWLKQNKLRNFPKKGAGRLMTILGFDDQA